ncbi:MAG TPA: phosphatidylserine/phosphatidylglycerophosphate/cardiolipin synthase family protein [Gaiellaceae bacterium]|nr:phosphatidylserine/phosphatidylglycerophosphate/cardiolipin synthase family protein [Gaiellaceae bacterium]
MLDDIGAAASSVHINQFGFKPGIVGDAFSEALLAKAAEGVHVRVVVDNRGSAPDKGSRDHYRRLAAGGVEVSVNRALAHLDHRKVLVVDGRTGWVGGAGIEDHFNDGRFHDLFVRVRGPVVAQLQLVFVAGFHWLGGTIPEEELDMLFPSLDDGDEPLDAIVRHNPPGAYRPITSAIARLLDDAVETLDVVNPYVTDRGMIHRIENAARRGVRVRLFSPAKGNNWACSAAQRFHHKRLLAAGVRILEYPAMLHAKACVRDGEELLVGTCNLDAWSLKRNFEIDLQLWSQGLAAQFDERFSAPAEAISTPGRAASGLKERALSTAFATISPLL